MNTVRFVLVFAYASIEIGLTNILVKSISTKAYVSFFPIGACGVYKEQRAVVKIIDMNINSSLTNWPNLSSKWIIVIDHSYTKNHLKGF